MIDAITGLFESVPHPVATILVAALPVGELRVAIPVSIGGYGIDPLTAYIIAVIGVMVG